MNANAFLVAALLAGTAAGAHATISTVDGRLIHAGDVALIPLTISAPAAKTWIYTNSYFSENGSWSHPNLDPFMVLWDSSGHLLAQNDAAVLTNLSIRPDGIKIYDTMLYTDLAPGDYTVSISWGINYARTSSLSDGFKLDNRTWTLASCATCTDREYWRLNTTAGTFGTPTLVSAVPEPASAPMLLAGLGLLGGLGWRRCRTTRMPAA